MKRAALLVTFVSSVALACSGPGAGELIERATLLGFGCLTISIVFTVFIARRRKGAVRNIAIALCMLHPGIWISAVTGDCGILRTNASIAAVVMHAALFAIVLARK